MKKERVKINEYLFFQEGPGVRNTQYTLKGVKLLNVANLVDGKVDLSTSDRYISEKEAYGKYKHFLVDEGDLIVASSGIKVEYMDKKMGFVMKDHLPLCMNTSTIRFKSLNNKNLDIRYFMYFLKSLDFKKQLNKEITGSAQLNYGPSHLKKMTFIIVDKENQLRVIKKLESIEKIIDFYQTQLKNLDLLIKSRFVEMFGTPDDIQNNKKYKLKEIAELITKGASPNWQGFQYTDDSTQTLFITSENVKNGYIDFTKKKYIENGFNDKQKRSMLKKGDILINIVGASIGRASEFDLDERANINQATSLVRVYEGKVNKKFLVYYLNSENALQMYDSMKSDTGRANLSLEDIGNLDIVDTPIELQNDFASFVEKVDKSKFAVQEAINKTKMLMDSLMQEYFG